MLAMIVEARASLELSFTWVIIFYSNRSINLLCEMSFPTVYAIKVKLFTAKISNANSLKSCIQNLPLCHQIRHAQRPLDLPPEQLRFAIFPLQGAAKWRPHRHIPSPILLLMIGHELM
jgi:hypothetical protein